VLLSGVTTAGTVTELSGRGVGLDVLHEAATQLAGEVTIRSLPGRGTTIDVCVPISMTSLTALLVEAGEVTAALPLDRVRKTARVSDGEIARSGAQDAILIDGAVLPFLPLGEALGLPAAKAATTPAGHGLRYWSAVVLGHDDGPGARLAAIGVDRLVGTAELVLRPLPLLAGALPVVAGASLDAEGTPQLVLDSAALVAAAGASRRRSASVPVAAPAPVLIVDDSLTTRMLEQSILESAGYRVETVTSGEEGLERAHSRPFSLFVVDVDMPGMNGFEFVERTRSDPELQAIPAILVTSRDSSEDRSRGVRAGAQAYIVKGEFDQGQLLDTIRRLVG
jgi:two-component system chemotaxis sensor kinase CheA